VAVNIKNIPSQFRCTTGGIVLLNELHVAFPIDELESKIAI
jgi:hypothetical protein